MISEVSGANRRFDVLGFKGFERLLNSDDEETKRWIHRLVRVFDDLDISGADKFDARVVMLEHTFLATIDILVALTEIDKGRTAFAEGTLLEAKRVKGEPGLKAYTHVSDQFGPFATQNIPATVSTPARAGRRAPRNRPRRADPLHHRMAPRR